MLVRPLAALAVSAALLLAGCGDDDPTPRAADPTPPASTAPATTLAPVLETPEEFVRRWFAVGDAMQNSGDTSAYRLASPECAPCQKFADVVDKYYADGGFIEAGDRSVLSLKFLLQSREKQVVRVKVDTPPTTYATRRGGDVRSFDGGQSTYKLTLERAGSVWQVGSYTEVSS